ncbi:MAG: hypothetical protein JXA69_00975 [Phycisphaerae bacterium]|nr:hypothetical protein [Phycisphaerae bacterium]
MDEQVLIDDSHEANRCNQRCDQMLLLVDPLDVGTMSPPLAAWLIATLRAEHPFPVGARSSGGAKNDRHGRPAVRRGGPGAPPPPRRDHMLSTAIDTPAVYRTTRTDMLCSFAT